MSFLSPVVLLFNGCRRLNHLTLSSHLCVYVCACGNSFVSEKRKWLDIRGFQETCEWQALATRCPRQTRHSRQARPISLSYLIIATPYVIPATAQTDDLAGYHTPDLQKASPLNRFQLQFRILRSDPRYCLVGAEIMSHEDAIKFS